MGIILQELPLEIWNALRDSCYLRIEVIQLSVKGGAAAVDMLCLRQLRLHSTLVAVSNHGPKRNGGAAILAVSCLHPQIRLQLHDVSRHRCLPKTPQALRSSSAAFRLTGLHIHTDPRLSAALEI